MKRLLMIVALGIVPTNAFAQGLPIDFDSQPAVALSGDGSEAAHPEAYPPSDTATSPVRARSVRHGERTILLIDSARRSSSAGGPANPPISAGS